MDRKGKERKVCFILVDFLGSDIKVFPSYAWFGFCAIVAGKLEFTISFTYFKKFLNSFLFLLLIIRSSISFLFIRNKMVIIPK